MRSPTTALLEGTPLTSGYFRWQKGLSGPGPGPGPATDPLPQDLRRSGCPAVEALTLSKHPKGWLHGLRFNPGIATCRGLMAGPDRPITLQETQWRHRPPTRVPAQHGQIMLSCWELACSFLWKPHQVYMYNLCTKLSNTEPANSPMYTNT